MQYIHEDVASSSTIQETSDRVLTSQDLAVMSTEWRSQLAEAALEADRDRVLNLIQVIPASASSLAHALENLVHRFQFDLIMDLAIDSETS